MTNLHKKLTPKQYARYHNQKHFLKRLEKEEKKILIWIGHIIREHYQRRKDKIIEELTFLHGINEL